MKNCFTLSYFSLLLRFRADFREGDEDSNFPIFRVRRFAEWPGPLHWIAFPAEILTKPLIYWIASPLFTENPFFLSEKCFVASPSQKSTLRDGWRACNGSFCQTSRKKAFPAHPVLVPRPFERLMNQKRHQNEPFCSAEEVSQTEPSNYGVFSKETPPL